MSHTQSAEQHGETTAALSMVNIDSGDPARQARFFAAALGWEVTYSDDNYGMVEGDGIRIGFGKIEGFGPAQWPDEAAESLCAIGASQPDFQPGAGRWRVLLDPDGQPICLSPRPAATS